MAQFAQSVEERKRGIGWEEAQSGRVVCRGKWFEITGCGIDIHLWATASKDD